jgi:DNA-binding CsgD family transcriptional regulator
MITAGGISVMMKIETRKSLSNFMRLCYHPMHFNRCGYRHRWVCDKHFSENQMSGQGGEYMELYDKRAKTCDDEPPLCPAKQLPLSNKDKEERVSSLTPREKDVFRLLLAGLMLKETAKELGIKYSTANSHMSAVYRKLNVNTRAELIINYGGIGR